MIGRELSAGWEAAQSGNTMIAETDRLRYTIEEYKTLVAAATGRGQTEMGKAEWRRLREMLSDDAAWTPRGATAVLSLAREYGSFVLLNALAMAVALGIEDGQTGL